MRCSTCKNCLSAIKKGHLECLKTFNYKKSKNALETAARSNKREIYNFLKEAGCTRSFVDEIHSCADFGWHDEFYSFYHVQTPDYETKMHVIRQLAYAAAKYGDPRLLTSVIAYFSISIREAFANTAHLDSLFEKVIKSEHVQKIETVYNFFRYRTRDWSPSDFDDAIATGNMNVLKCVIEMWNREPRMLRRAGKQMKLATIRHNRLVMLQYLDRFITGYPDDMLDQMRTMRGKNSQARREMIRYVQEELLRARRNGTASLAAAIAERERFRIERNRRLAERDATLERGHIYNEAMVERGRRMEQAQPAPVAEKITNLHKALALIEECEIPEGKYLELCNLLMDVHKRGVRA